MNFKKKLILFLAYLTLVFVAASVQDLAVKAQNNVVRGGVSTTDIPFGTVFPGEKFTKRFKIYLLKGEEAASYSIDQTPSEGLLNLCPYLTKENNEGEGDTEEAGSLSRADSDTEDFWDVILLVPDRAEPGDYGCEVEIRVTGIEGEGLEGGEVTSLANLTSNFSNKE